MLTDVKKIEVSEIKDRLSDIFAGDVLHLSGIIYTARDAAHQRIIKALNNGDKPPFEIENSVIYYVGPTETPKGKVIGSAGPTSSYRMDSLTKPLLMSGLIATIGKGERTDELYRQLFDNQALYLVATGGAGALLSKRIVSSEVIAYEDLGTEAVRKLEVRDFPVIVAQDIHGNNLFVQRGTKH